MLLPQPVTSYQICSRICFTHLAHFSEPFPYFSFIYFIVFVEVRGEKGQWVKHNPPTLLDHSKWELFLGHRSSTCLEGGFVYHFAQSLAQLYDHYWVTCLSFLCYKMLYNNTGNCKVLIFWNINPFLKWKKKIACSSTDTTEKLTNISSTKYMYEQNTAI